MDERAAQRRRGFHDAQAAENAEDLYARYFPLARATAARFLQGTGSDEDAEEVADDVMLELLAHPEKYDGGRGGLSTYVCVLARSRALNRRRALTRPGLPPPWRRTSWWKAAGRTTP